MPIMPTSWLRGLLLFVHSAPLLQLSSLRCVDRWGRKTGRSLLFSGECPLVPTVLLHLLLPAGIPRHLVLPLQEFPQLELGASPPQYLPKLQFC